MHMCCLYRGQTWRGVPGAALPPTGDELPIVKLHAHAGPCRRALHGQAAHGVAAAQVEQHDAAVAACRVGQGGGAVRACPSRQPPLLGGAAGRCVRSGEPQSPHTPSRPPTCRQQVAAVTDAGERRAAGVIVVGGVIELQPLIIIAAAAGAGAAAPAGAGRQQRVQLLGCVEVPDVQGPAGAHQPGCRGARRGRQGWWWGGSSAEGRRGGGAHRATFARLSLLHAHQQQHLQGQAGRQGWRAGRGGTGECAARSQLCAPTSSPVTPPPASSCTMGAEPLRSHRQMPPSSPPVMGMPTSSLAAVTLPCGQNPGGGGAAGEWPSHDPPGAPRTCHEPTNAHAARPGPARPNEPTRSQPAQGPPGPTNKPTRTQPAQDPPGPGGTLAPAHLVVAQRAHALQLVHAPQLDRPLAAARHDQAVVEGAGRDAPCRPGSGAASARGRHRYHPHPPAPAHGQHALA